ncbi:methyl farnesoate epoxidase-like [Daphnia carinata]|uniref:methyl farnesoate epoxidase-like n=1 Tax=Daphnia carinata TaxID=120202 RepID=UPI00258076F2|nr:methyl farnesoate epoxidase-like [Daphnia carinata]
MVAAIFLGLILLGLVIILLVFSQCRRPANIPPGPRGLPVVGYIPFLKKHDAKPYKALIKLSQTYGPVTGFYMGPSLTVAVCGYEAVKEALNNDDLNGRPDTFARRERTFGKRLGFMFVDGDFFREQRRFALRHLRDLGFGRTSAEEMIHEEIRELIRLLGEQAGSDPEGVVDFQSGTFNRNVLNILWALIGGERFRGDDARLTTLLDMVDFFNRSFKPQTASIAVPAFLLRLFPSLRKILGIRNDIFEPLQNFIRGTIEEHARTRSEEDAPRDYIDVFLKEMEKQQTDQNANTTFNIEQLISSIIDLFLAGSETSSNAIGFALLYLVHYPDVQRKMQAELDQICGNALPSLAHRPSLVYTEAVLIETLRLANVAPLTLMHCAAKDTQLRGFNIPKDTLVLINVYSTHMDETYWVDPEVFRPERHLDADGLKLKKSERLIPFGLGKRQCLGEPLARNSFFLFTTALVKAFQLKAIPDRPLPTLEPLTGVTNVYQGFQAIVTPRL